MRHPEFPVISFLVIPLLLSSLPSHVRARSVSTIALMAWLAVLNIIRGVNSLVWANNTIVKLEVWCDITTKILIGFTFAVPLSALCICRHLEQVSSNRQAFTTQADKRRRMKFEAIMCFGLPIIFMALHYVVQGHRFDLIEDVGCFPSTYFSVPAVIIVWVPPLVISLTSLVYAAASFHHFLRRRIEFATILRSSNSAITPGRYFRLMALAVFEILWDTGTNIYILYYNTFTGLRPWISWQNVHSNFSRVGVFPEIFTPSWALSQLIWQWWIIPISSISFFIFFGFGEEAMSDYKAVIIWLRRTLLRQNVVTSSSLTAPVLPTHHSSMRVCVNVDSLTSSDDGFEHDSKAWDDISIRMPETVAHLALHPSSNHPGSDRETKSLTQSPTFQCHSDSDSVTGTFSSHPQNHSLGEEQWSMAAGTEVSISLVSSPALHTSPRPTSLGVSQPPSPTTESTSVSHASTPT